jgi:hypothetical protein
MTGRRDQGLTRVRHGAVAETDPSQGLTRVRPWDMARKVGAAR